MDLLLGLTTPDPAVSTTVPRPGRPHTRGQVWALLLPESLATGTMGRRGEASIGSRRVGRGARAPLFFGESLSDPDRESAPAS